MLGNWFAARGNRSEIVLATKVGRKPDRRGLSRDNIRAAVAESLERLQTSYIDLYYAHADDPETPLEETLAAFDELVREGMVRQIAASNYGAGRGWRRRFGSPDDLGLARYVALQPQYSLVERHHYEGELQDLCVREGLACVPYWALARGFLTGKYRPGAQVDSPRAGAAGQYLEDSACGGGARRDRPRGRGPRRHGRRGGAGLGAGAARASPPRSPALATRSSSPRSCPAPRSS